MSLNELVSLFTKNWHLFFHVRCHVCPETNIYLTSAFSKKIPAICFELLNFSMHSISKTLIQIKYEIHNHVATYSNNKNWAFKVHILRSPPHNILRLKFRCHFVLFDCAITTVKKKKRYMQKEKMCPSLASTLHLRLSRGEKQRPVTTCMKMKCCQQAQRQNENLLSHHAYEWLGP